MRRIVVFFVVVLLTSLTFSISILPKATALKISPSTKDTYLDTYNPDTVNGAFGTINIEGGAGLVYKQRALLMFDLSSIISGSTVTKAILRLYGTGYWPDTAGRQLTVYRLTEDWDEEHATWKNRLSGISWAGVDPLGYGGTWASDGSISEAAVSGGWISWDVTEIVRAWIEGGQSNFGFIIKLADETGSNYWQQFASREYYDPSVRPQLDISGIKERTPPVGGTLMQSPSINILALISISTATFAVLRIKHRKDNLTHSA